MTNTKEPKLLLYEDSEGNEYIAIANHPDFERNMKEDGMKLIDVKSLRYGIDFTLCPTNRLMREE